MSGKREDQAMSTARVDQRAIIEAVSFICANGVTEVRALEAMANGDRWPGTYAGYFSDPEVLAKSVGNIKQAKGIYFTPNTVNPDLLARSCNRLQRAGKGGTTHDTDIIRRCWFLVDCDAQRPAGISATDQEHQLAIGRCQRICLYLKGQGWPDPIVADSGNGGHLMYRIDLPADDNGLVERCLKALALQFDDDMVRIDTTVHNPARIWKLYGTVACKGDSTQERPHRIAKILTRPETIEVVSIERLDALADESPSVEQRNKESGPRVNRTGQPFDIGAFIQRHNIDVTEPRHGSDKTIWEFNTCPLCDHGGDGPHLIQFASGALSAGCHHNSCSWNWHDLRALYEPQTAKPDNSISSNCETNGLYQHPRVEDSTSECTPMEPYKPFPFDALPSRIGDYVRAASKAIGCESSFIALPMLAALARAIGNKRVIRLKRTWTEPAIIWAAIIGKSGTHKTPALQAAMKFLDRRQAESMAKHTENLRSYEQELAQYEREYAAWKRGKSDEQPPPKPEEPACNRFTTSDCTIEALASLLSTQFDGLLVTRDELAGWLGGIAEYKGGKGSDLGHWLACWSAQPLTVDRKTGTIKMIHVPCAAVSLVGGIQPGVLRSAIGREHMQDGLCARLLLAMPPSKHVVWTDDTVDQRTESSLDEVFDRLLLLEPAANENGAPEPVPLDLTAEAKRVWVEYFNRHRAELVDLDDDLASAWSKLEAYAARFALIFQLCTWAAGDASAGHAIDEGSIRKAIELSDWFGGEAKRVYGMFVEDAQDQEQRELIELIQRKGGSITSRELMRSCFRIKKATEAEAALESLVKTKIGKWEPVERQGGPGRPTRKFVLNPADTIDIDTISTNPGKNGNCVNVNGVNAPSTQPNSYHFDAIDSTLGDAGEGEQ
jgi:uncharacterized protein DUF3987